MRTPQRSDPIRCDVDYAPWRADMVLQGNSASVVGNVASAALLASGLRNLSMRFLSSLAICSALVAEFPTVNAQTELRRLGSLEFEPCSLSAPGQPGAVEALCTEMEVPEDRAESGGRMISLAIAWVPSTGEAAPDPVFMLAGGPGQSAKASYPSVAAAFSEVNRTRDIILVDQRGTGDSNPLDCRETAALEIYSIGTEMTVTAAREFAEGCLAEVSNRADVRHYTTTNAIADLESVRVALGAQTINLYGASYGTRVAQQFAAAYPLSTRAVLIDSVVPNDLVLGTEHARNIEAALQTQFSRCQADVACSMGLADPLAALAQVRAALAAPDLAPVRYRDATTGQWHEEVPTMGHLSMLLRMYAYSPMTAVLLPVVVSQALAGDYATLLAQARFVGESLGDQIMLGLQLSVTCSEDADEMRVDLADQGTVMGGEFVGLTLAQCAVWPRGQRRDNFRAPLTGDLPVLAISGEFDPVTPPRYGEAAIAQLNKARHLVLRGQGHTVIGSGCMPTLFAQFIESTDASALDASCLDHLAPLPPGTGLYGWEP
jgi:pimeloyl-ACP methyl ester carboxylesterase